MFRDITIGAWDPGKFNDTLNEWMNRPDFNLFPNYEKYMKKSPNGSLYLIDPRSVWRLWGALQDWSKIQIRKNPPSSGFIGIKYEFGENFFFKNLLIFFFFFCFVKTFLLSQSPSPCVPLF